MKLKTGLKVSSQKGGECLHELENLKAMEELEARRLLFEAGDKGALFEALVFCAHFQAVIPDWLADVLIESERQFESGEIAHLGDIFGGPAENKAQRKAKARYRAIEGDAIHRLGLWRARGGSFNAEECFDTIKNELGCGRRDVENIYKKHKATFLEIEKSGPEAVFNSIHATLTVEDILPRRHGRHVLE